MSARATIAGHPIHPMLVTLPIGLIVFAFICDVAYLQSADPRWDLVAFYTLAGGLVTGLAAAIPGLIDYFGIAEQRALRVARLHMLLNFGVVLLVALSVWMRWSFEPGSWLPYLCSAVAVAMLAVSGWLGGELVHIYGVSLEPGAGAGEQRSGREGHATRTDD